MKKGLVYYNKKILLVTFSMAKQEIFKHDRYLNR